MERCYCDRGDLVPDDVYDIVETYGRYNNSDVCPCSAMRGKRIQFMLRNNNEHEAMKEEYDTTRRMLEERIAEEKRKIAKSERETTGAWYFITLTQPSTIKIPHERIDSANKIINSKQMNPSQWAYSLELTQAGTPHIHLRMFCEKYIDYRVVEKFNKGYEVKIIRETMKGGAGSYIVKQETKPNAEQLSDWGLDQWFWASENYGGPLPDSVFLSDV